MPKPSRCLLAAFASLLAACAAAQPALAQEDADTPETVPFTREQDVIYGRKDGLCMTMDVFTPEVPNGAAVVWVVSGGWFSSHAAISEAIPMVFLRRSYTVFAVVHGSQPRYAIPDCISDLHRAVRFIRANAERFGIDPERIGITGGSAGGHLSLMIATAGNEGNPEADDPVERASSRVGAAAVFFPPTDFLDWAGDGRSVFETGLIERINLGGAFDYGDGLGETLEMSRQLSPLNHVSQDDPPVLIIHGDADDIVPLCQAEVFVAAMQHAGLTAELDVREGQGHGWATLLDDVELFADWFDEHL